MTKSMANQSKQKNTDAVVVLQISDSKMHQQRPKYIAEGFVEDSGKLMKDFLQLESLEFHDFASVWRKHHFSLIFMGRPDNVETTEFVNEMFRLTTQYLLEDTIYQHVGGVYTLYALYRNQISKPKVKIRLETKHLEIIKSLREVAFKKKYKTLHYILDYLMDNAFLYVAKQTLRGPLIAGLPSAHDVCINKLKGEYKETFTDYIKSNKLVTLRDLHKQYLEEKTKIVGCANVLLTTNHEVYEEAVKDFQEFVETEKKKERNANVGSKKSKIKTEAFQKKSKNKSDTISDKLKDIKCGDSIQKNAIPKTVISIKQEKKPVRPRKEDRRPGRPPKNPRPPAPIPEPKSDDEIDISHLLVQQKALFLPPVYGEIRKNRTKRDPYYQVSPKRKEYDYDSSTSE